MRTPHDSYGDARFSSNRTAGTGGQAEPMALPLASANPYSSPFPAAEAETSARAAFIQKTYLHLAVAILGCIALDTAFLAIEPLRNVIVGTLLPYWWLTILGFVGVSWVAQWWANSDTSRALQYAGLALYVVATAVVFLPALVVSTTIDPLLPLTAAMVTALIFTGLTAYVMISGANFSFMGGFLSIAGLAALGVVLAGAVFGFSLGIWFSVAIIGLASAYIVYDTSNVLHQYRTDQYVAASLALFASVALLFYYVLRLLSSFRD